MLSAGEIGAAAVVGVFVDEVGGRLQEQGGEHCGQVAGQVEGAIGQRKHGY